MDLSWRLKWEPWFNQIPGFTKFQMKLYDRFWVDINISVLWHIELILEPGILKYKTGAWIKNY